MTPKKERPIIIWYNKNKKLILKLLYKVAFFAVFIIWGAQLMILISIVAQILSAGLTNLDTSQFSKKEIILFGFFIFYFTLKIMEVYFNVFYKVFTISEENEKVFDYLRLKEKYGVKK